MPPLPAFLPISTEVDGHKLCVLTGGSDRLAAILRVINEARRSLRLYYYIFDADSTGQRIISALADAAVRGVVISLIVDGYGSENTPDALFKPLIKLGVRFDRFVPKWGRRFLVRNHQKMLIADDQVAVIGGSNIADIYFVDAEDGKSWHDLVLVVNGPAAGRLGKIYDHVCQWVDGDKGTINGLIRTLGRASEGSGDLRWLMGGPFRRINPLTRALRRDIERASQVDMIQAYFAPNWGFLRKLGRVARRGRFRLITAARSDNVTTVSAARHCYRRLLRHGTEVLEYLPQMLHTKLIIADNAVWIGSANFDIRSLYLNTELALRIDDSDFADKVRALVAAHVPYCEPVTQESHRRNSPPLARLVRLISYFIVSTVDFRLTRRFSLLGR